MDILIFLTVFIILVFGFAVGVLVLIYPTRYVEYHTDLGAGDETVAKLVAIPLIVLSLFLFSFLLLLYL